MCSRRAFALVSSDACVQTWENQALDQATDRQPNNTPRKPGDREPACLKRECWTYFNPVVKPMDVLQSLNAQPWNRTRTLSPHLLSRRTWIARQPDCSVHARSVFRQLQPVKGGQPVYTPPFAAAAGQWMVEKMPPTGVVLLRFQKMGKLERAVRPGDDFGFDCKIGVTS